MPLIPILILAAGAGTRMPGRDKLMLPLAGDPLLALRLRAGLETGQPVFVTLPPRIRAPERWRIVDRIPQVVPVSVADAEKGLSASLKAGLAALPETAQGVLIVLADMPDISAQDMTRFLTAFDKDTILRATGPGGAPGHPVLLPRKAFSDLGILKGDKGARHLLERAENLRLIPLPGRHAVTDIDTEQDWQVWQKSQRD